MSLWDDKSAIYVAARLNGDMNIYDLDDAQMEEAQREMERRLHETYRTAAAELRR